MHLSKQIFFFENVFAECEDFLAKYPQETILMLINSENGENIEANFDTYKNAHMDIFYLETSIPILQEVRGKIVLFRRFKHSNRSFNGIDLQSGWRDSASFTMNTDHGLQQFRIEDVYNERDTQKKKELVETNLNAAKTDVNKFCITFNSVSGVLFRHSIKSFAWKTSLNPALNPNLIDFFKNNPGKNNWGTIMLDYYYDDDTNSNELVHQIIQTNFLKI